MMSAFPQVADPVASMLGQQIEQGINEVIEANKTLLAETESGTGVREIDKELKTFVASESNDVSDKDEEIVKAVSQLEKARKAFKTAQDKARNLYRVNVLHEDEIETPENDVDVDAVKQKRKMVQEAVTLLLSYAQTNNLSDVTAWANTLEIPQVGRQGSSTVGQKKPRKRVSVNDQLTESFGEAAKVASSLLSTEDNSVTVTSGDLVNAWDTAGEAETFDYQGLSIKVSDKPSTRAA